MTIKIELESNHNTTSKMVNEIQVCIDELILQIFEDETAYSFSFPLETQKEAKSFVKALHSRGLPYEQMCDEIEELEANFSAWRKGLGRVGIGKRVIQRINDPIQEIFESTDEEEEESEEEETNYKEVTNNGNTHIEQVTLNSTHVTSKSPEPEPLYPEETSEPLNPEVIPETKQAPENIFKPLHVNTQEKTEEPTKIEPSKAAPVAAQKPPKEVSPKEVSPKHVSPKPVSPKQVSPKAASPKQVSPRTTDSSGSGSLSPKSPGRGGTSPEQEPENGELANSPLFRRQSLRQSKKKKEAAEISKNNKELRRTPSPTKEPSDPPFGPRVTRSSSVRGQPKVKEVATKESPFASLKLRKTGNRKALVDMSFTQDLPVTKPASKKSQKSDGNHPETLSPSEKKGLFEAKMSSSENSPTRVSPKSPDIPAKPKMASSVSSPTRTSPKKELENKPARTSPKNELETKPARTSPKKELETKPARTSPKKELETKPARTSPKKELETKQDPPPSQAFIRLTSTEANNQSKNPMAQEPTRVHIHTLTSREDTKADIKAKLFGEQSKKVIINENYDSDADEECMDEEVKSAYEVFKNAADKKRSSAGFVYVLTDSLPKASKQRVKIGASRYPQKRLEQAQCLNLHVQHVCSIKVEDRKTALEQVLKGLDEYKVPGTTDWFKAPMNDIRHIVDSVSSDDSVC